MQELHANGIAHYRWGSQMVSLLGSATANGRMVVETLAQEIVGTFRWTRPRDVRAAISILHELIHLQQDVSTGLGAWDHFQTRESMPALVAELRRHITEDSPLPYRETGEGIVPDDNDARTDDLLRRIHQDTIGFRQLQGSQWNTPAVSAALERCLGSEFANAAAQGDFTLRQILEGEAACHVTRFIVDAAVEQQTRSELDASTSLWRIDEMPEVYGVALLEVMVAIANEALTTELIVKLYDPAMLITPWLLDLAQAHPPPRFVERFDADAAMFDPVVRFLVLTKALNKMSGDDYETMIRSIIADDAPEAERMLLQSSNFAYPPTHEIYTEWIADLDEAIAAQPWDMPLLQMRRDAISHRLQSGRGKGITQLVDAKTPLQMMVEGYGIEGIVVGVQFHDSVKGPLFRALIERNIDLELFDLLVAGGTFRCPLARAHVCDGRTPRCSEGIVTLDQLPPTAVCQVRTGLQSWGYRI
ncbi:hypothetical protein EV649_5023 [Kribbella sp. VKM Ac-2569]|uniref:hypothetical protein n=1 Tax=Kribbella sp. VKM Ac-2569 TaxID=2512220 RepID=UPI00102BE91E|nr:hypothetical protein [Kribbella sp. VKM Ac-2569]RZT17477.1 hypothetical protein EV649_5023 [Kribbella sp. VKM Ac-2569]